MKLNFHIDISNHPVNYNYTPSPQAKRLPFYLYGCGHFNAGKDYFTEREGLDNYLLFFTLGGCGYLKYRDGEYKLLPGQAAMIYCNEYQYYKTDSDKKWDFIWLHLNGGSMSEYFSLINGDEFCTVNITDASAILQAFHTITQCIEKQNMTTDIKISVALTGMLSDIVLAKQEIQNTKYQPDIDTAIDFITRHYQEKISIDEIIDQVHISKFHFIRIFKDYAGVSPYQYLINYRINQSKTLLKQTALSLSEIVPLVGFGDISNFIRTFKSMVGTTPSHYKKYWDMR